MKNLFTAFAIIASILILLGAIVCCTVVFERLTTPPHKPTVVVDITPEMEKEANKQYMEVTTYHYRERSHWKTELYEFVYKGHCYIYLTTQSSLNHAQHCPCLSTNK